MKSYKKDQRGITHNIMLAGIALLVLGAVSFAGFRVYKSKNDISAKAGSYTTIVNNSTIQAWACKTLVDREDYIVRIGISRADQGRYLWLNVGGIVRQYSAGSSIGDTFYKRKYNASISGGRYNGTMLRDMSTNLQNIVKC